VERLAIHVQRQADFYGDSQVFAARPSPVGVETVIRPESAQSDASSPDNPDSYPQDLERN
jgi:hypothetical protein